MIASIRSRFLVSVIFLTVPALTIGLAGCRGRHSTSVENDEGDAPQAGALASSIHMNDLATAGQLKKGFYGVESGAWRWTAGDFSVVLKTPVGAATRGGTLTLSLVLPASVLKQKPDDTLTASIGDAALKSEKYTTEGNHTFSADIPAAMLTGDTVTVDFSVDNTIPPGSTDRRELGVIVSAITLESK